MEKVLYLHIGWSKTGTSAVQFQLDLQSEALKSKGILYSKLLQMNDQAHHHFALAFAPIHGYPAKYNVEQALELLDQEMLENGCDSALISSELSPYYFNNPRFKNWISRFDKIIVIATVRRQSELLLSLFNQLVKDPQVRYSGRFFQLALSNFPKLNYFQNLTHWAKSVGDENIVVINYEDGVVNAFLNYFGLSVSKDVGEKIVNPSLPNSALLLLQEKGRNTVDAAQYSKVKDDVLAYISKSDKQVKPFRIMLTRGELQAIDKHFEVANNNLAKVFMGKDVLFEKQKSYSDVICF